MKANATATTHIEQRIVITAAESGRTYDLGAAPARFKWLWPRLWIYRMWHLPLRKRAIRRLT